MSCYKRIKSTRLQRSQKSSRIRTTKGRSSLVWCKSVLGLKRRIYKKLGLWKWRTIGAAIIGAVPIPFWDLALLAPVQIVMMIHTSKIYGLELSQSVAEQLLAIFADVLSTGHAVCVAGGRDFKAHHRGGQCARGHDQHHGNNGNNRFNRQGVRGVFRCQH